MQSIFGHLGHALRDKGTQKISYLSISRMGKKRGKQEICGLNLEEVQEAIVEEERKNMSLVFQEGLWSCGNLLQQMHDMLEISDSLIFCVLS